MPEQSLTSPLCRAISQLGDPLLMGVLWRSLLWAAVGFACLHVGALWLVHRLLALHGLLAYAADVLGTLAVSLLTLWLFLPIAAAIGTLYIERIARAVEQRFYPWLPPAHGASVAAQTWDGVSVALRILAFNVVALALAIVLPGIGLIIGWMIAGYAIGRGLFVAVAMRRMSRSDAESVYRMRRVMILLYGGALALIGYIPLLNLLLPVLATATMVHVLDDAMTRLAPRYGIAAAASS